MNDPLPDPWLSLLDVDRPVEWLCATGPDADVVLSSRVRLARNLTGFSFVPRADAHQKQRVLDLCRSRILAAELAPSIAWIDLREIDQQERKLLVERQLISRQHARGKLSNGSGGLTEPRAVAIAMPEQRLSIMVNEEDHLRIQVIRSGLNLAAAMGEADRVDDLLEEGLDFAYSPRFGYLTACPTNVGTGIRMSAMLHLPGLRLTGEIERVQRAACDMCLAVRGLYGEGSEAAGDLYQISNQTTLGKTERVIMHQLAQRILPEIVRYERAARHTLVTKRRLEVEDTVHRAMGMLRSSRQLSVAEVMQFLSHARLGVLLGLIEDVPEQAINRLWLLAQPGHLQQVCNKVMSQDERKAARASFVRTSLGCG